MYVECLSNRLYISSDHRLHLTLHRVIYSWISTWVSYIYQNKISHCATDICWKFQKCVDSVNDHGMQIVWSLLLDFHLSRHFSSKRLLALPISFLSQYSLLHSSAGQSMVQITGHSSLYASRTKFDYGQAQHHCMLWSLCNASEIPSWTAMLICKRLTVGHKWTRPAHYNLFVNLLIV